MSQKERRSYNSTCCFFLTGFIGVSRTECWSSESCPSPHPPKFQSGTPLRTPQHQSFAGPRPSSWSCWPNKIDSHAMAQHTTLSERVEFVTHSPKFRKRTNPYVQTCYQHLEGYQAFGFQSLGTKLCRQNRIQSSTSSTS